MNPCQLTATVTALANLLAGNLSTGELSVAAAILTQLGDTLSTIAAQRSLCCEAAARQDLPDGGSSGKRGSKLAHP